MIWCLLCFRRSFCQLCECVEPRLGQTNQSVMLCPSLNHEGLISPEVVNVRRQACEIGRRHDQQAGGWAEYAGNLGHLLEQRAVQDRGHSCIV